MTGYVCVVKFTDQRGKVSNYNDRLISTNLLIAICRKGTYVSLDTNSLS